MSTSKQRHQTTNKKNVTRQGLVTLESREGKEKELDRGRASANSKEDRVFASSDKAGGLSIKTRSGQYTENRSREIISGNYRKVED